MEEVKVIIVLVNYNGHWDTIECLESLFKMHNQNFSVVIVDNSTTDESLKYIQAWASGEIKAIETRHVDIVYPLLQEKVGCSVVSEGVLLKSLPKLTVVRAENRGFAAANNAALKAISNFKYDYVWMLNNDCIVTKDALNVLLNDIAKQDSSVGMLGASLYDYYSKNIQCLGGVLNPYLGTVRHIEKLEETDKVDYPVGASMLVSAKFVEDVGSMNDDYFLYYEEIDWVLRAKAKGISFKVNEDKLVYHKEGASTKGNNRKKYKRSEVSDLNSLRSRLIFMKIHFPERISIVKLGFVIVILNRIRRGRFSIIPKIFKLLLNND